VRLLVAFDLLLAALQLILLIPIVSGGRSLDFYLFRADALNLAFGAVLTLSLGIGISMLSSLSRLHAACLVLFSLSALALAYAREPLVFVVAWELAGLALWLPMLDADRRENVLRAALCTHLPGLLLLLAILLVPTPPFAPPQGGETSPWPLFLSLTFGFVALFRAGCWLFMQRTPNVSISQPTIPLYILLSPMLLAKALVAAPWDSLAVWLLALLGSAVLLASLLALLRNATPAICLSAALASASVVGLALAPLSPLAATGALGVLLAGMLWVSTPPVQPHSVFLLLACTLPGVWLLTQGALDARYRLVAAILLPVLFLLTCHALSHSVPPALSRISRIASLIVFFLLAVVAIYPQAAVDWVLRPAVGAMAGGVGVPSTLLVDHALGLLIRSPQETVLASLPATGIALTLFLIWAALYWLRSLARFISALSHPSPANGQAPNDA
jgi:hypothetical protein